MEILEIQQLNHSRGIGNNIQNEKSENQNTFFLVIINQIKMKKKLDSLQKRLCRKKRRILPSCYNCISSSSVERHAHIMNPVTMKMK